MKVQRRPFTLLEVLIAMGLAAVLLTALLGAYQYVNMTSYAQQKAQKEAFQKRLLQERLSTILTSALSPTQVKKEDFAFFTLDNGLAFVYDRGVDVDPFFANDVLARLYVHDDKLMLAMWPLKSRWKEGGSPPMKQEVLMEGVSHIEFRFWMPPDVTKGPIDTTDAASRKEEHWVTGWNDVWQASYKALPVFIRVAIIKEHEEVVFLLPLPNADAKILYRSGVQP